MASSYSGRKSSARIGVYFVAITACFTIYSLIQERLMTVGFGSEKEVFKFSAFVVFLNRVVTIVTSAVVLTVLDRSLAPEAPIYLFAVPSVANVIGSVSQYEALKYVSFPVQALAKCAKSAPVMMWSWITKARGACILNRNSETRAGRLVGECTP